VGTEIKQCTCTHKFQDETYGKGMRVHNIAGDGKSSKCTVCNNKRSKL
jgi:hypothetical protein